MLFLKTVAGATLLRAAVILFLACAAFPITASGAPAPLESLKPPPPGFLQMLRTTNGSLLVGRIQSCVQDTVSFETDLGVVRIPAALIENVRAVPETDFHPGKSWHPSPNATRLFFAPTGRMLRRGEGYFADYYLFFPSLNYGVTDNLSLGGGMSIFPSGSMKNQVYFFTPKFAVHRSTKLNVAAGAFVLKLPHSIDEHVPLLSVLYGAGTYGSPDKSVTVGIGYGFADRKAGDRPLFVVGGEYRVKRMISLVTENWFVPGAPDMIGALGVRFFGEDLSADLALMKSVGGESSPAIPYVDFVWHF